MAKPYQRWTATRWANDSCNKSLESRGGREWSFCRVWLERVRISWMCLWMEEHERRREGNTQFWRVSAVGLPWEADPEPELGSRTHWSVQRWLECVSVMREAWEQWLHTLQVGQGWALWALCSSLEQRRVAHGWNMCAVENCAWGVWDFSEWL